MPEGLAIDYDQSLNGTMAAYAQQMVICTGQRDWTSRIENDGENASWGEVVRGLKRLLGRGGQYSDVGRSNLWNRLTLTILQPFNNILLSASSFPASSRALSPSLASAFLFPSFKYFPSIPVDTSPAQGSDTDLSTFLRAFLLPDKLNKMYSSLPLPESKRSELTRVPGLASKFPEAVDIQHSPTILICGHRGRDVRCGIMAPVLEDQFRRVLRARGFVSAGDSSSTVDSPDHANIGLISHVGGHKYAGNVIIYIPPGMTSSPLAGKGIWYGRIEPKHVDGIVEETVLRGRVVADHFRGGVSKDGEILRL